MPATFSQEGVARRCRDDELTAVLSIVNSAAVAYRGVIPDDCWHEPYMTMTDLGRDIVDGLEIWGYERGGELIGVMGIQPMVDVDLIRHAYVRPTAQRKGVGAALIEHVRRLTDRGILVGTWAAASWAISFYERHGFELVRSPDAERLMRKYWSVPRRQMEVSVVLANPPLATLR